MFRNLLSKYYSNKTKMIIENNLLDIINYEKILIFEDDLVLIKTQDGLIKIKGSCLELSKSLDDELLIKGSIKNIDLGG